MIKALSTLAMVLLVTACSNIQVGKPEPTIESCGAELKVCVLKNGNSDCEGEYKQCTADLNITKK